MKLLSGSALPPSQEGPKTGELKIRVERLVLQHDKLDEERYADFCATECLWWGEENGPTSGYETPSTSTSSRGVVVYSYPIRTTRKLMGEYLELMNKNWGGLRIRVLVPASISGKKTNTPVGEAEILLDTLKPRSPISGWFAVQGPPAGEEGPAGGVLATGDAIVIGKVKLSVHMHYYNTKEKEESQKRAEVEEQQVVAARGRSASVGSGGSRSRTGTPEGAAATAGSGSATGAGGHTDPHTSDQPVGVVGIGLASTHPAATHPSTSDETTVVGSHTQGMGPVLRHQNYLEDILLRGQQLRQQMVSSMQQSGGSYGNGQGGASIGARSALPPMASVSGANGTAGASNNAGASADLPHNVKETMYSIQGKIDAQRAVHEGRNRVVTAGGHNTEGEETNGQPPEVTLFYPQPFIGERIKDSVKDLYDDDDDNDVISSSSSSSGGDCGYESEDELAALRCRGSQNHQLEPLKSYHGMHHAVIRITGLSFSRVMTEVRFKLRVSDDVTFVQPLAELVSPILELPWTGAIEFVLCLASYTNKSKIVLEAHEIISQYDPAKEANILMSEKLVGISVVGVFAQQQDFLSFHDPVHGGDPVRCSLLVSLDPVATEADRQVFLAAARTVAEEQVRRRAEDKEGRRPEQQQQQQQHEEEPQEVHQQVPAVPVAPPVPAAQQHPAKKSAPKSAAYHNNHRSTTTSTGSPSGLVKSPGQSNAGGGSANKKRHHNSATPSKARPTSNAVPPRVAAPTQPQAQQQQQPAAKPTSLFVLEVAVDYGKGLPEVEQHDSDVPEAPTTFVAIEDVFVNARAGGGGSSLASVSPNVQTVQKTGGGKNVSQNGASSIPLANWRCTGDRSDVVLNTVNPKYHFTADIDVPSMSEQVEDCDSAAKALKSLDKLTLSVWQHTPNFGSSAATAEGTAAAHSPLDSENELQGAFAAGGKQTSLAVGRTTNAAEEADGSVRPLTLSTQGIADEVDFWNRSEMLGKVNLDLKPLRYNTNSSNSQHSATGGGDNDDDGVIASLEGWYHVFDAQDAVLRTSIGQVKCHVRFVAV